MIIFLLLLAAVLLVHHFLLRPDEDLTPHELAQAHTPDDDRTPKDSLAVRAPVGRIVTNWDDVEEEPLRSKLVLTPKPRLQPRFDVAYAPVKRIEGGYQRLKADRGNYNADGKLVGTNWGIAAPVAERYFGRTVSTLDMKTLSASTAADIFRRFFWQPLRAEEFPTQELANIVFDGYVNHGRWGIRLLQRVLGVAEDGIVGPVTLAALHDGEPGQIYKLYYEARRKFYRAIVRNRPSQRIFERGWLRRLDRYDPDRQQLS